MKIDIICVGKVKEAFYRDAAAEYIKRLGRYAAVSVLEVADEPTPERASDAEEAAIRQREGERILKKISAGARVIALAIDGRGYSSEGFSAHINELALSGCSHIQFIIGGSLGLSPEVLSAADEKISFSAMTFPHQLMRVILLEQIYRAYRIIRHEPYHK